LNGLPARLALANSNESGTPVYVIQRRAIHRLVRVTANNRPILRDRPLDCSTPTTQIHHRGDGSGLEIGPQIAPGPSGPFRVRIEARRCGWRQYNLRAIVTEANQTTQRAAESGKRHFTLTRNEAELRTCSASFPSQVSGRRCTLSRVKMNVPAGRP
jgi:hypothetical protein